MTRYSCCAVVWSDKNDKRFGAVLPLDDLDSVICKDRWLVYVGQDYQGAEIALSLYMNDYVETEKIINSQAKTVVDKMRIYREALLGMLKVVDNALGMK